MAMLLAAPGAVAVGFLAPRLARGPSERFPEPKRT
jgi:hypothetical protein